MMLYNLFRNIKNSNILVNDKCIVQIFKVNYCKKEDSRSESCNGNSITDLIRHNFHSECEEGLNEQINCELYASYAYFCMSNCMSRPDVALFGFANFFLNASREEQKHAQMLVDFVNKRGGTVQLCDVLKPEPGEYHNPEVALEESILLEKHVLKNIEELHKKSVIHNDMFLQDFLEAHMIPEQYDGLQQLGEMLANVRRAGSGVGVVLLDRDLLRYPVKSHGSSKDEKND
ncbi:ferritin heavy chain, oocyte isoform-like [Homalodisca vitripennis]|uniref:ferritin heavy chain, oocyte isoform-like n=1 Tax=Homalodisca vitripennis TaxID=197043 RepID=UPI001EEC171D|nr:ferritin heavy chain, oocyte isoform-like [Homalodisca vitripennis]KAG8281787.1 oxidoreductase activity protein [Homalodisca vitripennis]